MTIEGTVYDLSVESNAKREASVVRATLNAPNLLAAEALAYNNILPIVSSLAFTYDVKIAIRGCVITEISSGTVRVRLGLLGQSKQVSPDLVLMSLTQETRMLLATYREASASSNIFLQALSYFKVVEGVYAIRTAEAQAAVAKGDAPTVRERELIPATIEALPYEDKWALDGFKPYLGKRFTWVRDDLRERLRHGLAHLLPGDTNIKSLSADVFNDVSTAEDAVPVLRYMARTLLKSYLGEHRVQSTVP